MIGIKARTIYLDVRTRAQRRAAVASIVRLLEQIRDAETKCIDNAPKNLSLTHSQFMGLEAVDGINDALGSLYEAYGSSNQYHDSALPF